MEDPPRNVLYDFNYLERAYKLMALNGPVAEALREYFIFLVKEKIGECHLEKTITIKLTWRKKEPKEGRTLTTSISLRGHEKQVYESGNVDDWDVHLLIKAINAVLDSNNPTDVTEEQIRGIKDCIENLRKNKNIAAHGDWARKTFKEIVQETEVAIRFLLPDSLSARRQEILARVKGIDQGVRYVLDDTPLREYRKELKNTVMKCVKAKGIAFEDSVSKCFGESHDDPHVTLFDSIDNSSMDEKDDGLAKFINEIGCEKEVQHIDERYGEKRVQLKEVSIVQLKLEEDQPPITWAIVHRDITKFLQEMRYENPQIEFIS